MQNVKYICPECGRDSKVPGLYPDCQTPLVASCPAWGNLIVGEHIHPES